MVTHPLLFAGDATSRARARRNLDFMFAQAQRLPGFFMALASALLAGCAGLATASTGPAPDAGI